MSLHPPIWPTAESHLKAEAPTRPVLYFSPAVLQATARRFIRDFHGLVTYAVKANDAPEVLENLIAAGLTTFDVASPVEMQTLRAISPDAKMHYNNPVRARDEIAVAVDLGVCSYSVDSHYELQKLCDMVPRDGVEVSVRIRLPVKGAAYDFGEKFGEDPEHAVGLLQAVVAAGFIPAMTFHPGTQCSDPKAWVVYIDACADIARKAGVTLKRLNVGGGFAANRTGEVPDLAAIFDAIHDAVARAFGPNAPSLVCEPGRAMVADSFSFAACVKSLREDGSIFLNDGIYGGFSEGPFMGLPNRIRCISASSAPHTGTYSPRHAFGPTCDSLDKLPTALMLPSDLAEGDYVLFAGMGAYSTATTTRFNGYGQIDLVTVQSDGSV